MYQPRTYWGWVKGKDLIAFRVVVRETDLYIRAPVNLRRKAEKLVWKYRSILESYIERHPLFLTSLEPVAVSDDAPAIVKAMAEAGALTGVGPMAAVAGAIAEFTGKELAPLSTELIIENGGDIYLRSQQKRIIGIYAGNSPLSGRIGIEVDGEDTPLGVCTSSGTIGHSLSFGHADAVTVISKSTMLADTAATAICNRVVQTSDIPEGINLSSGIQGLLGVVIVKDDQIGVWGQVKLCRTDP